MTVWLDRRDLGKIEDLGDESRRYMKSESSAHEVHIQHDAGGKSSLLIPGAITFTWDTLGRGGG
jgi:hypothetical protein